MMHEDRQILHLKWVLNLISCLYVPTLYCVDVNRFTLMCMFCFMGLRGRLKSLIIALSLGLGRFIQLVET